MRAIGWIGGAVIAVAASAAPAQAPGAVALAIQAGQVGERYDGYMGFAATPTPEVRRQVQAINIRRPNLYTGLASRRNVSAGVVGLATGCQLFRQLTPGEAYLLADGVWRRWTPGQPLPLPQQCG